MPPTSQDHAEFLPSRRLAATTPSPPPYVDTPHEHQPLTIDVPVGCSFALAERAGAGVRVATVAAGLATPTHPGGVALCARTGQLMVEYTLGGPTSFLALLRLRAFAPPLAVSHWMRNPRRACSRASAGRDVARARGRASGSLDAGIPGDPDRLDQPAGAPTPPHPLVGGCGPTAHAHRPSTRKSQVQAKPPHGPSYPHATFQHAVTTRAKLTNVAMANVAVWAGLLLTRA